jgi:hypothetical protein
MLAWLLEVDVRVAKFRIWRQRRLRVRLWRGSGYKHFFLTRRCLHRKLRNLLLWH